MNALGAAVRADAAGLGMADGLMRVERVQGPSLGSSLGPSLGRTIRAMVDPKFGIAHRLVELGASPVARDIFVSCADGGPPSYMTDHARTDWDNCASASGAAFSREAALWATLGELAERYCASIYDRGAMETATASALVARGEHIVPIEDMILFSDAQYREDDFPFSCYDKNQAETWQAGVRLSDGARCYGPAQLLYLSYEWRTRMLAQTVSTGLACHSQPETAQLSALLELIERDGFAGAWLVGMPLPELVLTDEDLALLSKQAQWALAHNVLQIKLRAIPNMFGVFNIVAFACHDRLGFGAVGASAKLCPYQAIEKAVIEALHGWIGFSQTIAGKRAPVSLEEIATPHDHALYYMKPERWAELDWFISGGARVNIRDLQSAAPLGSPQALVTRLAEFGLEAYLFDLTTDDMAALGLYVVRALVPGLQPLTFGKTPISQDRRRLETLADFWDWPLPQTLTAQPHPFP